MNKSIKVILNRTPKRINEMKFEYDVHDMSSHSINVDELLTRMNEEISER